MHEEMGLDALRARLAAYSAENGARQVLLLDAGGYVLCSVAGPGEAIEPVALGALAAGIFQAARELGRIFDEDECQAYFQQGVRTGIYTLFLAGRWYFITAFDRLTHLGLIQIQAAQVARELLVLLAALRLDDDAAARAVVGSQEFRADVDDALARLFQDDPHPVGGGA